MTTIESHPFTVQPSARLMTVEDMRAYLGVSKDFVYDQVRTVGCRRSASLAVGYVWAFASSTPRPAYGAHYGRRG